MLIFRNYFARHLVNKASTYRSPKCKYKTDFDVSQIDMYLVIA